MKDEIRICPVCSIPFVNFGTGGGTWYHCPRCFRHGFASIYGDGCADCSNFLRGHTSTDPLVPQFDYQRNLIP